MNLVELYKYLQESKIDPTEMRDLNNSTALHIATQINSSSSIKFFIRYIQEVFPGKDSEVLREWVNQKNLDGFTCLMYAVNVGNKALVNLYLKLGAEVNVTSSQGLGPLHIAAQSDKLELLIYFVGLGFDINAVDCKGRGPIHWAAYSSAEISADYLLTLNVDVNLQDYTGMTPLHLAVKSESARIVRHLLLRNANPDTPNYAGRKPIDYALDNQQIIALLNKPGLLSFFGIQPPHRPIKQKRLLLMIYILLLVIGISINSWISYKERTRFDIYYLYVISGVKVLLLVLACNKEPGYLYNQNNSLQEIADKHDPSRVCCECVIRIPPRSRHCLICNRCVLKFDHHCPWINNCVGAKNLHVFFMFIAVTLLFLCSHLVFDCLVIYFCEDFLVRILALCVGVICVLFGVPLSMLISVQIRNIISNTTTNERSSRNAGNYADRTDSDVLVNRDSVYRNCANMCCNSPFESAGLLLEDLPPRNSDINYSWIKDQSLLKVPLINHD